MELKDILKRAFEAGENYANSGEFAYYAPTFEKWYLEHESKFKKISLNLSVIGSVCFHDKSTWNEDAGCMICDDCNEGL